MCRYGAEQVAFGRASAAAAEFVKEHPMLTVVAIGMLAILTPWVVEQLGFTVLGPVKCGYLDNAEVYRQERTLLMWDSWDPLRHGDSRHFRARRRDHYSHTCRGWG